MEMNEDGHWVVRRRILEIWRCRVLERFRAGRLSGAGGEGVGRRPRHTDYSGDGAVFTWPAGGGRPAVTPGSRAATPAAIGSFRINPLNR